MLLELLISVEVPLAVTAAVPGWCNLVTVLGVEVVAGAVSVLGAMQAGRLHSIVVEAFCLM